MLNAENDIPSFSAFSIPHSALFLLGGRVECFLAPELREDLVGGDRLIPDLLHLDGGRDGAEKCRGFERAARGQD
jgi:hypothetical protein